MNRSAPRRNRWFGLLLDAEDGIFGGFGHAELDDALGGNLNGLASLRVAAHAGGAIFQDQLANAGQGESVLRVFVSKLRQMVEDFSGLLFGELRLFRDRGNEL
jgi:hypothetical protein